MTLRRSLNLLKHICHILLRAFYSWVGYCRLRLHGAQVGSGFRIYGWLNLQVHDTGRVIIGRNVRMNSGFALNPVGGSQHMGIWVGRNAVLQIGDNVGISSSTIVCMNRINIEDDVFIGGGCSIYDTDFHPVDANARLQHDTESIQTRPILIAPKVFVGGHSIILKGTSIGSAAVIGAGAVVAGEVPPLEVWVGNPARPIKKLNSSVSAADLPLSQG